MPSYLPAYLPTSAGGCAIRGRLVQGLAGGPTASGPEAMPTHRPRQTVEALVWLWRATSLTYACVRHRFDKMANMPLLGNTHTHLFATQFSITSETTRALRICVRDPPRLGKA